MCFLIFLKKMNPQSKKPESQVRTALKDMLSQHMSVHVYHASPYGETGHPDLYGTYRGCAVWLEVKHPGWRPRSAKERNHFERQKAWLAREQARGGFCAVVTCWEDCARVLEAVDNSVDQGMPPGYYECMIQ